MSNLKCYWCNVDLTKYHKPLKYEVIIVTDSANENLVLGWGNMIKLIMSPTDGVGFAKRAEGFPPADDDLFKIIGGMTRAKEVLIKTGK